VVEIKEDVDLRICSALLMKEWVKRYKKVFKIDFDFKLGDEQMIQDMVRRWGYERTFVCITGAIRFYPELWQSDKFKWLTVNQVYTWIGEEVWKKYLNKEFKVRVIKPKI
jgi:hypothetical protein